MCINHVHWFGLFSVVTMKISEWGIAVVSYYVWFLLRSPQLVALNPFRKELLVSKRIICPPNSKRISIPCMYHHIDSKCIPKYMIGRLVLNLLKFCDAIAELHYSSWLSTTFLFNYHEYFRNVWKQQTFYMATLNQYFLEDSSCLQCFFFH